MNLRILDITCQPYAPRNKCGAGAIIGGAVAGLGALASSLISHESATANNAASMNFSSAENEKAREWQDQVLATQYGRQIETENRANSEYDRRKALDMQATQDLTKWIFENYESPSAQVAALRKAGLNPAMILGGNSGFGVNAASPTSGSTNSLLSPSSGVAAPMMSVPSLENTGEPFARALDSSAKAFNSMLGGLKTDQETERLRQTQQIYYDTMFAEKQMKETGAKAAQFSLSLDQANLPKKQKYELDVLHRKAENLLLEGLFTEAKKTYSELQSKLADLAIKKNSKELEFLPRLLELEVNSAQAEIAFKLQQEKTSKAEQVFTQASTAKTIAETKTINATREYDIDVVRQQANDLANRAGISESELQRALFEAEKFKNLSAWRKKWPRVAKELDEFRYITGSDTGKTVTSGGNGISIIAGYLLKALK